jgi:hypothetical protein
MQVCECCCWCKNGEASPESQVVDIEQGKGIGVDVEHEGNQSVEEADQSDTGSRRLLNDGNVQVVLHFAIRKSQNAMQKLNISGLFGDTAFSYRVTSLVRLHPNGVFII